MLPESQPVENGSEARIVLVTRRVFENVASTEREDLIP